MRSAWAARSEISARPGCEAIANPVPPVEVTTAPCQEVVITGEDLTKPGGGLGRLPVPVSTPGFDAAPYLDRDAVHHHAIPKPACRTWAPIARRSRRPTGWRCAWRRALGGAGGYLHWLKYQKLGQPMPSPS